MLPLGHIVFVYDVNEIIDIVISSVKIQLLPIIFVVIIAILYPIAVHFWEQKIKVSKSFSIIYVVFSILFSLIVNFNTLINNDKLYKSYSDYCLATNQFAYTLNDIKRYYKEEKNKGYLVDTERDYELYDQTIIKKAKAYQGLFPSFSYVDDLYPYMRVADDKDVLGGLIDNTSDGCPPNFVFIIIEGYGRQLTATDPQISYTPFIDSLASEGLFWGNCLALSERTFGALPNIFSSAPPDKSGFARQWFPIPDHNSILKDMSKNRYQLSFYYGGNASFDGQDDFMLANGVSYIMKPTAEQINHGQKSLYEDNHSWGMFDKDMFKAAFDHRDSVAISYPFTDIYMTLTTHEPFLFDGIEEYEERVVEILNTCKTVSKKERANIMNNKNIYACFLYVDDCIRDVVEYYKNRQEFDNTIFVITGDHRMGKVYVNSSELLKYHVPLVIYSPLIKEHKEYQGVVTHHDIVPTITSYLRNSYDYKTDTLCHWLGTSLDTASGFSTNSVACFMLNSREVNEFMYHDKFIYRDRLYKINPNLLVEEIDDDDSCQMLQSYMEDFKEVNCYVAKNDYLLKKNYNNIESIYDYKENTSRSNSVDKEIVSIEKSKERVVVPPIKCSNLYEKLFIDMIFEYKFLDSSQSDDMFVMFKVRNGEEQLFFKAFKVKDMSTELEGGYQRFRVKTTFFLANKDTDGGEVVIVFKSMEDTELEYRDLDIKISAVPMDE